MAATDEIRPLQQVIDEVTEEQLRKALKAARGSAIVAANTLQIDRSTVYRLMRKFGIEVERVVV